MKHKVVCFLQQKFWFGNLEVFHIVKFQYWDWSISLLLENFKLIVSFLKGEKWICHHICGLFYPLFLWVLLLSFAYVLFPWVVPIQMFYRWCQIIYPLFFHLKIFGIYDNCFISFFKWPKFRLSWCSCCYFPDITTAAVAKESLEGHCIYDGGYCKLHLSYSRHTDLNVKVLICVFELMFMRK